MVTIGNTLFQNSVGLPWNWLFKKREQFPGIINRNKHCAKSFHRTDLMYCKSLISEETEAGVFPHHFLLDCRNAFIHPSPVSLGMFQESMELSQMPQ